MRRLCLGMRRATGVQVLRAASSRDHKRVPRKSCATAGKHNIFKKHTSDFRDSFVRLPALIQTVFYSSTAANRCVNVLRINHVNLG